MIYTQYDLISCIVSTTKESSTELKNECPTFLNAVNQSAVCLFSFHFKKIKSPKIH